MPANFPAQPLQGTGQNMSGQHRTHQEPTPPNPQQVSAPAPMLGTMIPNQTINYFHPTQQVPFVMIVSGNFSPNASSLSVMTILTPFLKFKVTTQPFQKRERKPIPIVDPRTNTEVSIDGSNDQAQKDVAPPEVLNLC